MDDFGKLIQNLKTRVKSNSDKKRQGVQPQKAAPMTGQAAEKKPIPDEELISMYMRDWEERLHDVTENQEVAEGIARKIIKNKCIVFVPEERIIN